MSLLYAILISLTICCIAKKTPVIATDFDQNEEHIFPQNIDFEAYRRLPLEYEHGYHKPLHFDGVKGIAGGCFDPRTGYFKTPVAGLYMFNFTTPVSERTRLMKDNYEVRILSRIGNGRPVKSQDQRNILLQLDKDDKVWLRLTHGRNQDETREGNDVITTFSGRLLTTELNLEDSTKSRLNKRSLEQKSSKSLQRFLRDADYSPVSLVERHFEPTQTVEATEDQVVSVIHKIAFSVTCTKSMIGGHMADTTESLNGKMNPDATPNGRLGFDKVLVNIGGGFDLELGQFEAPTAGVYFFTYNVGKFPRKKLSVMLMKNFNEVQSIIYNDSKSRAREMQGQSLMLHLKRSDKIWLRSFNNKDYAVYSNLGNYITFSGYLVYSS